MVVTRRLGLARDIPWLATRTGPWVTVTPLTRCLLFALGVIAAALVAGIFELLHIRDFLLVAGIVLVPLAEWLVAGKSLFRTGIEEALELAGLIMIAFFLAEKIGAVPFAHVSLWLAAVLIFAGLRFLNPLFIVLGAAAFSSMIFDLHAPGTGRDFSAARVASAACFTIAAIALALGQIGIRRPSYDRMLDALVAAMPLFGFLWMLSASMSDFSLPAEHAAARVHVYPAAALLLFGGVALIVGIRRRTHAPLAAFMVCAACLVYELRNLTGLSLEVRLIVAGTAVLALTMWLDRYLRTPRRAVISQKVAADGGAFDLLQLIGAVALTPPSNPRATPGFEGGGGTAGGGGASGNF